MLLAVPPHVVITAEERPVLMTEEDRRRLLQLLQREYRERPECRAALSGLLKEVHRADVMSPAELPADVVTLGAVVELTEVGRGHAQTVAVVLPEQEDLSRNRLSVLRPLATAILGHRVGDEVAVGGADRAGGLQFKIENLLYQPEQASW
ncbi:GreA/GreB family elongation factor [Roseimaritima sediminicola]|uniref:GreA/GreB family elongation factor n=1 Tax=Roseimaritima sediminicola TaxID=2662066 RepID=UPI0012984457|nr:GreA/GreB family elongation factor [Roseimaritima sediminicola]